jgi:hypothetical protein
MEKLFNPVERNLRANPSLLRTNSPWRLWLTIFGTAVILIVVWWLWPAGVSVTRPILNFSKEKTMAVAEVRNRTVRQVTLNVRFEFGRASRGSDSQPAEFGVTARKTLVVSVAPRSAQRVECEMPGSVQHLPNHVQAHIVSVDGM